MLSPAVPVYITYLTAMPNQTSIAFFDDVYGRDKARLAALQNDAAVLGMHAPQESVGLAATAPVGLKRTFHRKSLRK